jgi:cell division protein FtsB
MLNKDAKGKILISLVLVIISANFVKSSLDALGSKNRLEEALEKEKALTVERDGLQKQVEYKKTAEYIEESARNELNMIKTGEKVYVVKGVEEGTNGEIATEVLGMSEMDGVKEKPNWYVWYKLFF